MDPNRRVAFTGNSPENDGGSAQFPAGFDPSVVTRFNIGSRGNNHSGHGHSHGEHGHSHGGEEEHNQNEEESEVVFTLSELVPGAAIRNLLVRVCEVKENGEAQVENAHGRATLVYDVDKIGLMVRAGSTLRISDGFGFTQDSGNLVIRLEDPEEESCVVEMNVDEDDITPPPEVRSLSSITRLFGLLVIRENRCLLCPAAMEPEKFIFPVSEANGDEPERTAALQAFTSITDIDLNEVYILSEIAPIVSYEEDHLSTLFVAYSRRPFKKNQPPTNTEAFSWFTFEEAMNALETDPSKDALTRAVTAIDAAVTYGYVKPSFSVRFGPANGPVPVVVAKPSVTKKGLDKASPQAAVQATVPLALPTPSQIATISPPSSVPKPSPNMNGSVETLLARTSALFYLHERGDLSQADFLRLIGSNTPLTGPTATTMSVANKSDESASAPSAVMTIERDEPVPVTVLCGFLGAGKTTMINHLMSNKQKLKIALVVNDMAELNVDAKLIRSRISDNVVEMSNGCICCTLREDLLSELAKIAGDPARFDCIVVESTGIGDPMGIAETFTFPLPDGRVLNDVARLDTIVTVVDSSSVLKDMNLTGKLAKNADDPESGRLSRLLTEQIEFADVVVMNKIDLVNVQEMGKVRAVVHSLNPSARKIECTRSAVALSDIIDTKLFSFENAEASPGWLKTLRGEEVSESEEFGITSVVWRSKQPISPAKLAAALQQSPFTDFIIRSKGIIWLGNKLGAEKSVEWAGSGHAYAFYQGKPWVHGGGQQPATGLCEVVLIGFFEDKSVPQKAIDMLNSSLIEPESLTAAYDFDDDNESIKVMEE